MRCLELAIVPCKHTDCALCHVKVTAGSHLHEVVHLTGSSLLAPADERSEPA